MRPSNRPHALTLVVMGSVCVVGLCTRAALTTTTLSTAVPSTGTSCNSNCLPLTRTSEEIIVPLEGTPSVSGCVPPGTWVCGYMKIKNTFSQSLCGTKVTSEVSSFGKINVPGVGEFKTSEVHTESNTVTPSSTTISISDNSRYTAAGCGESYRMYVKLRIQISADGTVARCESIDVDCYTPCCGN